MGPSDIQLVIPMSGFGERFRSRGYSVPKPLIEVGGKPIIEHILNMFPGVSKVFFICNRQHLDTVEYRMAETLLKLNPHAEIVAIPPHTTGPVGAILSGISELKLDPMAPVIVNYCDFCCYWDFTEFLNHIEVSGADGCIPAYRGFHPHSDGPTNYAYLRESSGVITDISEKAPFTDNKTEEYASSGTYYFRNANIMHTCFQWQIENNLHINGEYYVSLAYKYLFDHDKLVTVYPLKYFMQWGTPDDLEDFLYWYDAFTKINRKCDLSRSYLSDVTVVAMAGSGERFLCEGYSTPKPLINVGGMPMVSRAVQDLPPSENYIYVTTSKVVGSDRRARLLERNYPNSSVFLLNEKTNGQATSVRLAIESISDERGPVIVCACDNGMVYDYDSYYEILNSGLYDVIVWGALPHPSARSNPNMYGWIDSDGARIKRISVKRQIDDNCQNPIVMGTFTFRTAGIYKEGYRALVERNATVNGEFYIDELINDLVSIGYRCMYFKADAFICWGTPKELKTYEYWSECFSLWDGHEYRDVCMV